jgi:hypothetical protein
VRSAALAVGWMSQTFDIAQLTNIPTTHPKITSPTLCSPLSKPAPLDPWEIPAAITMAVVIGAWRHMVLMRITYDEINTVRASAKGIFQWPWPPMRSRPRPTTQPTSTLTSRLRNRRRASSGCGSEAATIEAIAQIGLLSPICFSVNQTMVVAMKTLTA